MASEEAGVPLADGLGKSERTQRVAVFVDVEVRGKGAGGRSSPNWEVAPPNKRGRLVLSFVRRYIDVEVYQSPAHYYSGMGAHCRGRGVLPQCFRQTLFARTCQTI